MHSTVRHSGRLPKVITVRSGAHVQAVKQLNEHHLIHAGRNNNGSQPVFRAVDARASGATSHVSNQSEDHGFVSCWTRQQTFKRQDAPWSVTDEVSEFLGPTIHKFPKGRCNIALRNQEGMVPNLVVFSLVPAQFVHRTRGCGGEQFICYVLQTLRPRLDASERSLRNGTAALGLNNLCQNQLLRRSSNCRLFSPGLCRRSPRSCVNGAVTVRSSHSWIFLRVVNVRLHGFPVLRVLRPLGV